MPKERVSLLAGALIKAANDIVVEHEVTYEEYNALKAWLIKVGTDGEWPLFLDVWLEHTVEDVNSQDRPGTKGTIEGPYYVPGSPVLGPRPRLRCATTKRALRCSFSGRFTDTDGNPIQNAQVEIWHADAPGSTPSTPRACRTGSSAPPSRPTTTAASTSTPCARRPTRFPRTGPAGS